MNSDDTSDDVCSFTHDTCDASALGVFMRILDRWLGWWFLLPTRQNRSEGQREERERKNETAKCKPVDVIMEGTETGPAGALGWMELWGMCRQCGPGDERKSRKEGKGR